MQKKPRIRRLNGIWVCGIEYEWQRSIGNTPAEAYQYWRVARSRRVLDPDDLGYSVGPVDRDMARQVLGIPACESYLMKREG